MKEDFNKELENIQFVNKTAASGSYAPAGGPSAYGAGPNRVSGSGSSGGGWLTKGKSILIIVLLLALLIFGAIFASTVTGKKDGIDNGGMPYVGVLHIEGTIGAGDGSYNHSWVLKRIREMRKDDDNEGILLYVDSPGGSVYQTDEVYQEIIKYQEETKRPVYSYYAEYAASGAYYLSASSDWIVANRFTTTGSIGVYMGPVINAGALMEKAGIEGEYIKAGANKAMGNYFDPLTDEQREILQSSVDEIYDIFVGIVADGRGMSVEEAEALADGRSYSASQALENGLIDQIGTLSDTKKLMKKETGIDNFVDLKYVPEQSLFNFMISARDDLRDYADAMGKSDVEKALDYVKELSEQPYEYMVMLQPGQ